jgi:cell division protein FtsB
MSKSEGEKKATDEGAGGSFTEPVILDYFKDAEAYFMPYFMKCYKEAFLLKPGPVGSVSFEDVMQAGYKIFKIEEFSATTIAHKMCACFEKSKEKKNGQFHALTECGYQLLEGIFGRIIKKDYESAHLMLADRERDYKAQIATLAKDNEAKSRKNRDLEKDLEKRMKEEKRVHKAIIDEDNRVKELDDLKKTNLSLREEMADLKEELKKLKSAPPKTATDLLLCLSCQTAAGLKSPSKEESDKQSLRKRGSDSMSGGKDKRAKH